MQKLVIIISLIEYINGMRIAFEFLETDGRALAGLNQTKFGKFSSAFITM
jgi:hypothetical protein